MIYVGIEIAKDTHYYLNPQSQDL